MGLSGPSISSLIEWFTDSMIHGLTNLLSRCFVGSFDSLFPKQCVHAEGFLTVGVTAGVGSGYVL